MGPTELKYLRSEYADQLKEGLLLSAYTSARVGGPSDAAIIARSKEDLAKISTDMWEKGIPFMVIGGGSNLLFSDKGIRELLIINKAKSIQLLENTEEPLLEVDSGTTMNNLAQKAANWGLGGLEWAATIPGTLGGAVFGNAGAFQGDMAGNLESALINFPKTGPEEWTVDKFKYDYRSSILKRNQLDCVILSAILSVSRSKPETIRERMAENNQKRQDSQPKGASMGSTFKNPPGDHAGRLLGRCRIKRNAHRQCRDQFSSRQFHH